MSFLNKNTKPELYHSSLVETQTGITTLIQGLPMAVLQDEQENYVNLVSSLRNDLNAKSQQEEEELQSLIAHYYTL